MEPTGGKEREREGGGGGGENSKLASVSSICFLSVLIFYVFSFSVNVLGIACNF